MAKLQDIIVRGILADRPAAGIPSRLYGVTDGDMDTPAGIYIDNGTSWDDYCIPDPGTGDVPSSRAIATGNGLTGGGDLSADRTLAMSGYSGATSGQMPTKGSSGALTWIDVPAAGVASSRAIATGNGLTGGGDLSADRSLAMSGYSAATAGYIPTKGSSGALTWIDPSTLGGGGGGGAGLASYDSGTAYGLGDLVIGSDTNWYRAIASTTGHDPTTDDGTYWELNRANDDTTLAVDASGRFATLPEALTFLQNAAIAGNATVTVTIADDTYNLSAQITWTHVFGNNIQIVGNTTTPGNVILNFNNSTNGFFVDGGATLRLNGVQVQGAWDGSASGEVSLVALFAYNNSRILLGTKVKTKDFYYGVQAARGSFIDAPSIDVNGAGDVGIFAYDGGIVSAINCTVALCRHSFLSLGWGIQAEIGGIIYCNGATVTTCLKGGIFANGGRVRAYGATSNSNTGHGWQAERGGVLEANGSCQGNSNGGDGWHLNSGSRLETYSSGLQAQSNTGAGIWAYNHSAVVAEGASVSSNGGYQLDFFGVSYGDFYGSTVTGNVVAQLGSMLFIAGSSGSPSYAPSANNDGNQGSYIRTT